MSMKEAFETFFEERTLNNIKKKDVPPKVPCNEDRFPTGLFLLDILDVNGYAQWKPKLQEKTVSFISIEMKLGFSIHPQIKEFLSTYWFLALDGIIQTSSWETELRLTGLTQYSSCEKNDPQDAI